MKPIDELGISPWPWKCEAGGSPIDANDDYLDPTDADARLIAAAPEMYEALMDCCEEVNEREVPRCYACRRGEDGHCMARGVCKVYLALAKASGEEEKQETIADRTDVNMRDAEGGVATQVEVRNG